MMRSCPRRFSLPPVSFFWGVGVLAVFLLAAAPRGAWGQTTFFTEDFETDGSSSRYTIRDGSGTNTGYVRYGNDSEDYYGRCTSGSEDQPSGLSELFEPTGESGSFYNCTRDLDNSSNSSGETTLEISDIDITGQTNLSLNLAVAADGNFESSDELKVSVRIDGSGSDAFTTIGTFTADESQSDDPLARNGNVNDGEVTTAFSDFTFSISGTGSTLDVKIFAVQNGGSEGIDYDNLRLTSTPILQFTSASATVNENEGATTLAVEILNPPSATTVDADVAIASGGSNVGNSGSFPQTIQFPSDAADGNIQTVDVDVASDGNAVFDLKNVSGGSAAEGSPSQFTLTIQDAVGDHSGDVMITEFMAAPSTSTEYVELYNTTGSDITMNSWTLRDEAGNSSSVSGTIPARGFFLLCGDTDPAQGGIRSCDDSFFAGLNDSGDGFELLDGGGAEIDTVGYSGSTDGIARIFTGTTDNQNADGSNWTPATRRERGFVQDQSGDDGSPGRNGTGQVLQPTTEVTGGAGWRMLSAPMSGVTPEDLADVSLVQGISGLPFSGAAPNLYQWPGGTDANQDWTKPSSATEDLTGSGAPSGATGGFVWYVFDAAETAYTDTPPFTLSVPGAPRTSNYTTGSLGEGFHLLGNPYAQSFDLSVLNLSGQGFQTTVQVWDPSTDSYESITQSSTADDFIGPYQGFFVERTSGSNTLTINASGRRTDPIDLQTVEDGPARIDFQLVGRGAGGTVLTRDEALTLHALNGATAGWDVHDASKLTPLSGRYATAAFRGEVDGEPRLKAVSSIPSTLPEEGLDLPVSLQVQGTDPVETFELSWPSWTNVPDEWGLSLYDTVADTTINLRTHSDYTFTLSETMSKSVSPPRSPLEAPDQIRATAQSDSARFVIRVQGTPLPVELTDFKATRVGKTVQLAWTTASETNNAGFHVQHRGPEAERFRSLGFVEGHGTTGRPQQYRFRTAPLDPGRHVFRLRQVDVDGTAHRSDTVAVRVRLATAAEVDVAPNPVRHRATVSLRVRVEQDVTVALYDVLGRRVRTLHNAPLAPGRRHTMRVNVGDLSSGLYLLRVQGEQFRKTRRLTVVR